MTLANSTLTPIGRLENTSDRVGNLRQRLNGLRELELLSPVLCDDLAAVRQLLDGIDRAINEAIGRVHGLSRFGDDMSAEAKHVAYELVLAQDPWINYADARLGAANIAYLALDRIR